MYFRDNGAILENYELQDNSNGNSQGKSHGKPDVVPKQTHKSSNKFPTWLLVLIIGLLLMGGLWMVLRLSKGWSEQGPLQSTGQNFGFRFF